MIKIANFLHYRKINAISYCGGKFRVRKQIGAYLNKIRKEGQAYYEPFVGGGWILSQIKEGPNYASDANEYLIAMWKAVKKGWIPPSKISEAQYAKARKQVKENDGKGQMSKELLAFIGFGSSFAGKWYGGYARDGGENNFAEKAKNSLKRKVESFDKNTSFKCHSYEDLKPEKNSLIYCDPPYEDTTQGYLHTDFDSDKFWDWVRKMSKDGHTVLVSEYKAPKDFKCVLSVKTTTGLSTKDGKESRFERVYQLKGAK
jgi:DNA adenine methylase